MKFFTMFYDSAREMKQPRSTVTTAMLIALSVVLSAYATIRISQDFQISFGYLGTAIISMLFGPTVNAAAGVITDLVSYVLYTDGPYCFWFALNPIVSGIIFSCFFYRRPAITPVKAIAAKLIDTLVVEVGMTSIWLMMLYGLGGWPWFLMRTVWKLAAFVVQAPVLYFVLKAAQKAIGKIH